MEQQLTSLENPKIVTLCGSTRFRRMFEFTTWVETMKGNMVLSCGAWTNDPGWALILPNGERVKPVPTDEDKKRLDRLHLAKIDIANYVIVIDVAGERFEPYLGESTLREIAYAGDVGVPVKYLSTEIAGGSLTLRGWD